MPSSVASPVANSPPRAVRWAGFALVLALLAAYANSFSGPFLYDDRLAIAENLTIRQLWPLWTALSPPHGGMTVEGRPLLNLSFAINYAIGGDNVRNYHALNLLIHALAALTLLGLVRRTFLQPALRERFGSAALPLALTIAALWALHPLQTEAVTYIVQRAESLMALCYLLTLYCFVRGVQSTRPAGWFALAILACLAGVGVKEVIVSAPLVVLLYDRTFVAGTLRAAWQPRRRFYLALAATWIPLGWLVATTGGNRGGSMGFGIGVSWWEHTLTQFEAIARYLGLSLWPHPLVFDYGAAWLRPSTEILLFAAPVVLLVAGTAFALRHRPAIGFLGASFLAILSPTSLMPQLVQIVVEHRMYLPLAAVLSLLVAGLYLLAGRRALAVSMITSLALGGLTFRRNYDYQSEILMWQDTVAKRPTNAMAHCALGVALADYGRVTESLPVFEAALRLEPDYAFAHCGIGNSMTELDRPAEAVTHLELALRFDPKLPEAHLNLGLALNRLGRFDEALPHFEAAVRLKPALAEAQNALAAALARRGETASAIPHWEEALRVKPGYTDAACNLAITLVRSGHLPEATARFEAAIRLNPANLPARLLWSNTLAAIGHLPEALAQCEATLRLRPDSPDAHYLHGNILGAANRVPDAIHAYREALRLRPDYPEARTKLALATAELPAPPGR